MDFEKLADQLKQFHGPYPKTALEEAINNREKVTPGLLSAIRQTIDDSLDVIDRDDYKLCTYSMYLLAQYYLSQAGQPADLKLEGLAHIYHNMQVINESLAERLRAVSQTDASVNALILLDMYARHLPIVIEDSLRDLRCLFEPFFSEL